LSPSRIEVVDDEPNPPPTDLRRKAALRGVRLHSLFERLPDVAPHLRAQAADRWLLASAGEMDPVVREEIVKTALAIIGRPDFADVFSADALAEAPIAGLVDDRVVAGTVDRLLITDDEVHVIDFKTSRRTPASPDSVSSHYKAQMGAYAALLANIFPGRKVRASLLYTHGPVLIELPPEVLSAYKPGFSDQQQELIGSG
jgi:ATP-dependent helicase/nuclease subunit A